MPILTAEFSCWDMLLSILQRYAIKVKYSNCTDMLVIFSGHAIEHHALEGSCGINLPWVFSIGSHSAKQTL